MVSKIAVALTVPVADASAHRLGQEFNLPVAPTAPAAHQGARLLLMNAAWGLSTPRSLPPKLKASEGWHPAATCFLMQRPKADCLHNCCGS